MDRKQEFINEIIKIQTLLNKVPTRKEYNTYTTLDKGKIDTLSRLFGSYGIAIKEAGLIPIKDFSNKGKQEVQCSECSQLFIKKNSQIKLSPQNFCCRSCSVSYNNKINPKRIKTRPEPKYKGMNRAEANQAKSIELHQKYILRWKENSESGVSGNSTSQQIKKYMLNKYNHKCSRCQWGEINPHTQRIPLELEHIDGNYKNNNESNLIILCPNCHSLTATYKGANRGNSTRSR